MFNIVFVRKEGCVLIMVLLVKEPGQCQDDKMDTEESNKDTSQIMKSKNFENKSKLDVEESLTFIEDIVENYKNFSEKDPVKTPKEEDEEFSRWLEVYSFLYLESGLLFCRTCVSARPGFRRARPCLLYTSPSPRD